MTHSYHEAAENYDERQILHDECAECEARGKDIAMALHYMDGSTFSRAWERAHELMRSGENARTGPISRAELDVLRVLGVVGEKLEYAHILPNLH